MVDRENIITTEWANVHLHQVCMAVSLILFFSFIFWVGRTLHRGNRILSNVSSDKREFKRLIRFHTRKSKHGVKEKISKNKNKRKISRINTCQKIKDHYDIFIMIFDFLTCIYTAYLSLVFIFKRPLWKEVRNIFDIWTLTKRLEKKLDGNYTKMLRAILNKSWQQHPTRHQLYGHLPPITKTI